MEKMKNRNRLPHSQVDSNASSTSNTGAQRAVIRRCCKYVYQESGIRCLSAKKCSCVCNSHVLYNWQPQSMGIEPIRHGSAVARASGDHHGYEQKKQKNG